MPQDRRNTDDQLLLSFTQQPQFVPSSAIIVSYEDMMSAPKMDVIPLTDATEFIGNIANQTWEASQKLGGDIPFSIINELAENFIHAHFCEPVISIFDNGNTIRFSDQGPGISDIDLVCRPGFTSATEEMKSYIRGVGSGLALVKEYLEMRGGSLEIEPNIGTGCVVTVSLNAPKVQVPSLQAEPDPLEFISDIELTSNETKVALALYPNNILGVTEISKRTNMAVSSVHAALTKLQEYGVVTMKNKKRLLTSFGFELISVRYK